MITNDDRYVWLLANLGLVTIQAYLWNPQIHKPLLTYLQEYIDKHISDTSLKWLQE